MAKLTYLSHSRLKSVYITECGLLLATKAMSTDWYVEAPTKHRFAFFGILCRLQERDETLKNGFCGMPNVVSVHHTGLLTNRPNKTHTPQNETNPPLLPLTKNKTSIWPYKTPQAIRALY